MRFKILFITLFLSISLSPYTWGMMGIAKNDINIYVEKIKSTEPHIFYKEINKDDGIIEICNKVMSKSFNGLKFKGFSDLSDEQYQILVKQLKIFPEKNLKTKNDLDKAMLDLILWARLAGCPLLALNKNSKEIHNPYKNHFPTLLKGACVNSLYNYEEGKKEEYNEKSLDYYKEHAPLDIAYELLKDNIIRLSEISNVQYVLQALKVLPLNIVNSMRGKAIYLSSQEGPSMNIAMTTQNAPVATYPGLISGIFIERHPKGSIMTMRNIVHEIGHLIDQTMIRSFVEFEGIKTIPFRFQSSNFLKLQDERNIIFPSHDKKLILESQQFRKGSEGYITGYAEQDDLEDFAEHFRAYFYPASGENFEGRANKEEKLRSKLNFMKSLGKTLANDVKDLSITN